MRHMLNNMGSTRVAPSLMTLLLITTQQHIRSKADVKLLSGNFMLFSLYAIWYKAKMYYLIYLGRK